MERGFNEFIQCFDQDNVDVANDEFILQTVNGDGACITSLSINGNQLLAGKHNDLQSFWMEGDDLFCLDNFMSTRQIRIQNGQVRRSTCKPMHQSSNSYPVIYCKITNSLAAV